MGSFSRNKGARGEREVVKILQPVVNMIYAEYGLEPPRLLRNQMQTHVGGFDIVGLDWLALEVKFCEVLNLGKWWDQAVRQSKGETTPVLIYRKTHQKWRVRFPARVNHGRKVVTMVVDVAIESFLDYMKMRIRLELEERFGKKV